MYKVKPLFTTVHCTESIQKKLSCKELPANEGADKISSPSFLFPTVIISNGFRADIYNLISFTFKKSKMEINAHRQIPQDKLFLRGL